MRKKLAIVGSGISGMACAYYLRNNYDITIFEKNNYLGGHTHTHQMYDDGRFTLDTGFIVFNEHTYPNLLKLFKELGIEKQKSDMSFSVQNLYTGLEYGSEGFCGLFSQKKNIFSIKHWKFLLEVKRFFKVATRDFENDNFSGKNIEQYCKSRGFSYYFLDNYLVPMASAVWSTPHGKTYDFPIKSLIPFFHNHGLLDLSKEYQWYTVRGGSNSYIKEILKKGNFDIRLDSPVEKVYREKDKVIVKTASIIEKFDYVVMSSHSDESLNIVKDLDLEEKKLLGAFPYNDNKAILHKDDSVMPQTKNAWTSWNTVIDKKNEDIYQASVTYWLNKLQKPKTKKNYFLTLNPIQEIDKDKVVKEISYNHPLFTSENFELQNDLPKLNKDSRILFSGAYFGYGFHEDGLKSALSVVKILS